VTKKNVRKKKKKEVQWGDKTGVYPKKIKDNQEKDPRTGKSQEREKKQRKGGLEEAYRLPTPKEQTIVLWQLPCAGGKGSTREKTETCRKSAHGGVGTKKHGNFSGFYALEDRDRGLGRKKAWETKERTKLWGKNGQRLDCINVVQTNKAVGRKRKPRRNWEGGLREDDAPRIPEKKL